MKIETLFNVNDTAYYIDLTLKGVISVQKFQIGCINILVKDGVLDIGYIGYAEGTKDKELVTSKFVFEYQIFATKEDAEKFIEEANIKFLKKQFRYHPVGIRNMSVEDYKIILVDRYEEFTGNEVTYRSCENE